MIEIKEIRDVPELNWAYNTKKDRARANFAVSAYPPVSDYIWSVSVDGKIIFIAGVLMKTILGGPARLWVLLTKDFRPVHVRHSYGLMRELSNHYSSVITGVEQHDERARAFAEFWGFVPSGVRYTIQNVPVEDFIWRAQ